MATNVIAPAVRDKMVNSGSRSIESLPPFLNKYHALIALNSCFFIVCSEWYLMLLQNNLCDMVVCYMLSA